MSNLKYTKEILAEAISSSNSLSEVLRKIGANPSGNTRKHIRARIKSYGLSIEHFTYVSDKNKDKLYFIAERYLTKNPPNVRTPGSLLKKAMLSNGLEYKCSGESCEVSDGLWGGQLLPLDVDHIDGDYTNNLLNNLRFLCPNCHRLTKTYGNQVEHKQKICSEENCNNPISKKSERCVKCSNKNKLRGAITQERKNYPSNKILIEGIEEKGYLAFSKELELTDNGLRKLLQRRGINPLPKRIRNTRASGETVITRS